MTVWFLLGNLPLKVSVSRTVPEVACNPPEVSAQTGWLTVTQALTLSRLVRPVVLKPGWRKRYGRLSCPACPHGTAEGVGG